MTEFKTVQDASRAPPKFLRADLLSLIWLGPTEGVGINPAFI